MSVAAFLSMDPLWLALAFIVTGVLLLIVEYAAPKSYLVIPGIGMLVLGVLVFIDPSLLDEWWSIIIFAIVLILMLFAGIKFFQMLAPSEQTEALVVVSKVGKIGTVTEDIIPNETTGKVKFDDCIKNATAAAKISAGTQVVVLEDFGTNVVVAETGKNP